MADEKKKPDAVPPSQVEITTVPRVYLKNPAINRSSAWHRAYVGGLDGTKMEVLEIVAGTKKGVPIETYRKFADAGVITTERPQRRDVDDDL